MSGRSTPTRPRRRGQRADRLRRRPVNPGDLVVADCDGVVVVPRREAAAVVAAARAKMRKEDELAAAIKGGQAIWDLSGAAEVYARLGIVERDAAFDDPA